MTSFKSVIFSESSIIFYVIRVIYDISPTLTLNIKNPFHNITHCQQLIDVLTFLNIRYVRGPWWSSGLERQSCVLHHGKGPQFESRRISIFFQWTAKPNVREASHWKTHIDAIYSGGISCKAMTQIERRKSSLWESGVRKERWK